MKTVFQAVPWTMVAMLLVGNPASAQEAAREITLEDGTTFALRGQASGSPQPTVFVFAADRGRSLREDQFIGFGPALSKTTGCLFVSLDAPAHGDDRRADEPDEGLQGWRLRLDRNEDFIAPFVRRASAVLDYLVAKGLADPTRVAVAGTSRGGLLALHFAAHDSRIRAVALFSAVTDLTVLREFKGLEGNAVTQSLAAGNLVDQLAGRPIWHCIGNHDLRVGTRESCAFSDALVMRAQQLQRAAPVEIHIMESEGHRTPRDAWDLAAAWLGKQLNPPGT